MIGHLQVPQQMLMKKPLWYFEGNNKEGVQKMFKKLKKMTGYQYDNTHLQWSNIFGEMFTFSVYVSGDTWSISVWDHTGGTSVCELSQPIVDKETDTLSQENYNKLSEETKAYTRGMTKCSGCKEEIKQDDIAGRYFAGTYCEGCWEGKWKAIEAEETYN